MAISDDCAARLASIAMQLADRVRDEDPEDVGVWLRRELTTWEDWTQIVFVLAAAVPVDVPFSTLTAWVNEPGDPVINQRRAILNATTETPRRRRIKFDDVREKVVEMRGEGFGYGRIALALGCDKSTVAKWCRNELEAA